jgi:V8-like Glu-specific endopeptidase
MRFGLARAGFVRANVAGLAMIVLAISGEPAALYAADISVRRVALSFASRVHAGAAAGETQLAESQRVFIPQARWLRLEFRALRLGPASFLRLRGEDGSQDIDARAAQILHNRSAFFDGDYVELELHVAPGDPGAQFILKSALTNGAEHPQRSVPPPGDVRVPVADRRVGRALVERADGRVLVCTAWLVGDGVAATAGHCARGLIQVHFEPPASAANGELRFPPPERQFWPEPNTLLFSNGAPGADWAVLRLTGPSAAARAELAGRGGFTLAEGAAGVRAEGEVRVPGFGGDYDPTGAGRRGENAAHHVLQASSGGLRGECRNGRGVLRGSLSYSGYFLTGASGAPILNRAGEALGLHTHGEGAIGCGASVRSPELRSALERSRRN